MRGKRKKPSFDEIVSNELGDVKSHILSSEVGVRDGDWRALIPTQDVRQELRSIFMRNMFRLEDLLSDDNPSVRLRAIETVLKYGMGERIEVELQKKEFIVMAARVMAEKSPDVNFNEFREALSKKLEDLS